MRLLVWPNEPARALGRALAAHVGEVIEAPAWQAASALADGTASIALVPTLEVLRDPEAFDLVENVALVGESSPDVRLVVRGPLDAVRSLAFDPRYGQEALLAAVLLREHYGGQPTFSIADPSVPLNDRLDRHGAVLASAPEIDALPADAVVLDLGAEWLELTTRPFPWALLAAPAGELEQTKAALLAAAARGASAPPGWQFELGGYGHAGLEEFAGHLFYHGALQELPGLPGEESDG